MCTILDYVLKRLIKVCHVEVAVDAAGKPEE